MNIRPHNTRRSNASTSPHDAVIGSPEPALLTSPKASVPSVMLTPSTIAASSTSLDGVSPLSASTASVHGMLAHRDGSPGSKKRSPDDDSAVTPNSKQPKLSAKNGVALDDIVWDSKDHVELNFHLLYPELNVSDCYETVVKNIVNKYTLPTLREFYNTLGLPPMKFSKKSGAVETLVPLLVAMCSSAPQEVDMEVSVAVPDVPHVAGLSKGGSIFCISDDQKK